jgi:predicted negative regulator of RcsB-dependent stress response
MNKYCFFFFIFFICGCNDNSDRNQQKVITWKNREVTKQIIKNRIRQLVDSNKCDKGLRFLDTLIVLNQHNGFLYLQRGFLKMYKFNNEEAVKDFEMAEKFGYDPKECKMMILVCQKAIDEKKAIDGRNK